MKGPILPRLRGLGDGGALFLFCGVTAGGDEAGGYASGEDSEAMGSHQAETKAENPSLLWNLR